MVKHKRWDEVKRNLKRAAQWGAIIAMVCYVCGAWLYSCGWMGPRFRVRERQFTEFTREGQVKRYKVYFVDAVYKGFPENVRTFSDEETFAAKNLAWELRNELEKNWEKQKHGKLEEP